MSNPSSNLEDVKNEAFVLNSIPVKDFFEALKCSREGLTSDEAAHRLAFFGPNKLPEKKESQLLKFLGSMWNPLSWVIVAAAIMAITLAKWLDIIGVMCLLVIHSTISFIEETKAGNAAASRPVTKHPGDPIYSGSTCKEGQIEAVVFATGVYTFFGKATF